MDNFDKANLVKLGSAALFSFIVIALAIMFFYGIISLFTGHFIRAAFMLGIPVWLYLTLTIWSDPNL